jgi:hypothetical protein
MKADNSSTQRASVEGSAKYEIKSQGQQSAASSPWSAVHRIRLPHKPGLPLSSGGAGDGR